MKISEILNKSKKDQKKQQRKKAVKNIAIGTGIGAAVGAAAGILLAPKSGKETREDITKAAKETIDSAKESIGEVKVKLSALTKKDCCSSEDCCSEKDEEVKEEV